MLFILIGCAVDGTAADDTNAVTAGVTYFQDVRPILQESCVGCHNREGIGTFPLESYDDVVLVKDAVADAVAERRMPPWLAGQDCNDYLIDMALTDEEIALVTEWVADGAPEGDEASAVDAEVPELPRLEDPDFVLELPEVYTPTVAPDDYRCFVVDWPAEESTYVVGYDVLPGNDRVVHHLVAYIAAPEHAAFYEDLDAADPGAGYSCYGGPGAPDGEDQNYVDWLGGWAPGGGYSQFPHGAGIEMEPGSKVILQMHYNLENADGGEDDRTRMAIKTADSVEREAWIQPWADPDWLGSEEMEIPAGAEDVTHSFRFSPPVDLTLFTANLHMHQQGVSARMFIERAEGDETCLLDIPRWDFNWQRGYGFVEPEVLRSEDTLVLECTWDNNTDEDIHWGDGTGDEMCLGTMLLAVGG